MLRHVRGFYCVHLPRTSLRRPAEAAQSWDLSERKRRAKSPYRQDSTACADVEHDLAFETVSVIHYGMVVSVHPPHVAQHLLLHRAQARGTRHNITNGTISQESTGRALLV
jgi:hypothetical protein